jgi:thiaminase/transcriptional activator TenA
MDKTAPGSRNGFTGELWRRAEPIYGQILEHPFLRGLTDGTLPRECFQHYVLQDGLYLREYARALSLAGVKSPGEDALAMFNEHSAGAISVEKSLHEGFLKELGISEKEASEKRAAPTTLAYTSYVLRVAALGDYHQVLGAVLPCYWIYRQVGLALMEQGSSDPLYERWIQTYGGEEFGALVDAVLDLTDHSCGELNARQKEETADAYLTTSRYEWMFWNMGWTLEEWPVGTGP